MIVKVYLFLTIGIIVGALPFIYDKTEENLLIEARKIGEEAKIQYYKNVVGVEDQRKRNNYYLDALQKCDTIGNEHARRIEARTLNISKKFESKELQKVGLKEFTAQFMTLPKSFMAEVISMACSKHEQQLLCGSVIEGNAIIEKRIEDLKTIGNHLQMFEHECPNPEYAPKIYPCIGNSVKKLRMKCGRLMDDYWNYRENANANISQIYETSLATVKHLKASSSAHQSTLNSFIFKSAMRNIVHLEGEKCGLFITMRECALSVIKQACGIETAKALNTSISVGYLRTERKERLHLDFDVFNIPIDSRCNGL
uniref:Venom protein n=1 Tax=Panagrolaimus sp. PS1159 TaxID=55785 RepID=A0AC35G5S5_9BILA